MANLRLTWYAHFSQHPRPTGFSRRRDQWRIKRMKTNRSFLRNITHIFFLATVTLLLLSVPSTTFADNATWDSTSLLNTDWNTDGNWTTVPPGGTYPGTPPGTTDTATFNNLSSTTSLFVSFDITIAAINFTASETHAFTITVDATKTLTVSGTGITNSTIGPITQNFVTAVDGSGNFGQIRFTISATAGIMTAFTNNGATLSGGGGGETAFFDTSTADHGTMTNNGGTVSGAFGGFTSFSNFSTAGNATFTNNGGTVSGAGAGVTQFNDTSTAGSGTFTNNGGTVSGGGGGETAFFGTDATNFSTAGSATITNNGGTVSGAGGGFTSFSNFSTAGN